MENKMKYIALETKSFTEGQTLADIIKGNVYTADKEEAYFIGEFGNTIYLPHEEFNTYFKNQVTENTREYRNKYHREKVKGIHLRLFPSDKDIIEYLEKLKSTEHTSKKNGVCEYIRRLIREDMKRQ